MNEDQKKAIETLMPTLVEVLESSVIKTYLRTNGFLNDNECHVVNASGPTNGDKIIKIFGLVKWKEGSWELVMKYLSDHKYPWLVTALMVEAKMETAETQQKSTSTPVRIQSGSAAASNNAASHQSSNPPGRQMASVKPQLQVSPVAKMVKSTSDLSINHDATLNLALKDKILMFEGKSLMYGSNTVVKPPTVQQPTTNPHRNLLKQTGTAGTDEVVSTPTDLNKTEDVDDVEKIITNLKEKSKCQPFALLLPGIISLMQIYSTTSKFQLECIRLIQTFLPQKLSELTVELKANLVETMLTCLQSNFNDELIVDCYTDLLAKLEIFADPIEKFTKTIEILLKIISNPEMTTTTKRSTIWLLNEILLKSDENYENLVGQMGGVEQICKVIRQQLNKPAYDRILVSSWISLLNLCFESLENAKKFVSAGGVDLFHHCYEKFGDEVEMIEMMMRMMSIVSWFQSARQQLVSKRNFDVIWKILLKFNDNVAVSWVCVNAFAEFLSDSTLIWPLDNPTVEVAKNLLIQTINKWKLNAQTNLNWSSFNPFLNDLKLHKSHLNDLLLIWSFANFTTVDAPKYCRMLSEAGGVKILTTEVIRHSNSSLDAVVLAKKAIDNVDRWAKSAVQQ